MRVVLLSFLLVSAPAFAQKSLVAAPPEVLSPTLTQGWQVQPSSSSPQQQAELAMKWAKQPTGTDSRGFEREARGTRRERPSTVGQGLEKK